MEKIIMKPRIFILSNGELAEPQYFHDFKRHLKANNIRVIEYKRFRGKAPWEFIDEAVKCKHGFERSGKFIELDGDQFWCVFDVDDYWAQNQKRFKEACVIAKRAGIRLAWSNECFELWFLCHFGQFSSAVPRKDYHKKLSQYFKENGLGVYKKNMENMFRFLLSFQSAGINNARRIYSKDKIDKNPSSAVFLLVEEMNNLAK
ncbi:hypothetical protein C0416_02115 [bacterium]|nr:hypothetical protein [bacterium]